MLKKFYFSIAIFCAAGLLFGIFAPVNAADSATGSSKAVTISPPIQELKADPGSEISLTIRISNPGSADAVLYPKVMNFKTKDFSGQPLFYEDGENNPYAMDEWMNISTDKIVIEPKKAMQWSYSITVPADASPGGHYGAVFFATSPDEASTEESNVSTSSMVGSLVLLKVSGDLEEGATISEFSSKKLYYSSPVDFNLKIANTGNVHIKPQGKIYLKKWGRSDVAALAINASEGNVLPGGTRAFNTAWNFVQTPFWKAPFGYFTATFEGTYGDSNLPLTSAVNFWIIPIWVIVTLSILVLLLISSIVLMVVQRKKARTDK